MLQVVGDDIRAGLSEAHAHEAADLRDGRQQQRRLHAFVLVVADALAVVEAERVLGDGVHELHHALDGEDHELVHVLTEDVRAEAEEHDDERREADAEQRLLLGGALVVHEDVHATGGAAGVGIDDDAVDLAGEAKLVVGGLAKETIRVAHDGSRVGLIDLKHATGGLIQERDGEEVVVVHDRQVAVHDVRHGGGVAEVLHVVAKEVVGSEVVGLVHLLRIVGHHGNEHEHEQHDDDDATRRLVGHGRADLTLLSRLLVVIDDLAGSSCLRLLLL
mmetsp:Transcript_19219/g.58119  ORF Transcript_19219/g.58119 Transcript_19219/m.58119 type:complete len:275 (+) Transcript_19219:1163-1987(+)